MQHRYVGDIGDYLKLALLRAVQPERALGIAWWLFPDENHNRDGRHVSYLADPRKWRSIDPPLFDHLSMVIASGQRDISVLQSPALLANASYAAEHVPRLSQDRALWLDSIRSQFERSDVVFFDPDNGLEPAAYNANRKGAGKSVTLRELHSFRKSGRTLIVYHHQTRAKGGHLNEIRTWCARLEEKFDRVDAVRCKAYSSRVYFLLDSPEDVLERVSELCCRCGEHMVLNPHLMPN